MGASIALVILSAAAGPLVVAAPGLTAVGVEPARAEFFSEHAASALVSPAIRVVTPRDIGALLGMERQKQLLGCSEDQSACLAELGAAMGAEVIFRGDLARVDDRFQINLKFISARDGAAIATREGTVASEAALTDWLSVNVRELGIEVLRATGRGEQATQLAAGATRKSLRRFGWGPLIAGAALAGGGAVCFLLANSRFQEIEAATHLELAAARRLGSEGALLQTLGVAGVGVGVAAVVTGVLMFVLGREPAAQVSVGVVPQAASLFVGVPLP